ncbi:MAG: co-chaperone DjlA [Nitrosomonas sp.]|nr:co-chaperone DjlA [Nitrosomonas sp.]MDP1950977.1 co-chaperone DjlA [Nitrosomonas sp.]
MFKLIGALIGFLVLGFLGAFLGFILGGFVDRFKSFGAAGVNPFTAGHRQTVFIETVFILMGKLAKADGQVTKVEISHVEQFIQRLGMTSAHRLRAISLFKQGTSAGFDYGSKLNEFVAICGHTHSLRQMLLVYLIILGLSDGQLNSAEEQLLKDIARRLGYSQSAFRQLLEMVLNQTHFAGGQVDSANAVENAYKALGVTPKNTDKEIKHAYRKLMSQYHPDKLMGQGVPDEMISIATEQAKEVQTAYDLIKKDREQNNAKF